MSAQHSAEMFARSLVASLQRVPQKTLSGRVSSELTYSTLNAPHSIPLLAIDQTCESSDGLRHLANVSNRRLAAN
jgi:hypothetical protein